MPSKIVFDPVNIGISCALLLVLNLIALATRRILLTTAIFCGLVLVYLLFSVLESSHWTDWGWLRQAYFYLALIGLNGFFMDRWQKAMAS